VPLEAEIGLEATAPGDLTLSVGPFTAPVAFQPTGSTLSAALPAVTIRDTRTDVQAQAGGWSVSGRAKDFSVGNRVIGSDLLTWAPAIQRSANGASAGTAGAALKAPAILAEADQANRLGETVVGASLTLSPPSDVDYGRYGSEITLSLFAKD
jgi:alkaline phosphatase